MRKFSIIMGLLILAFAMQCYGETGGADSGNIWTRDKLTGDWGGWRTDLQKSGIDFDAKLTNYFQSVASGGANTKSAYGGKLDYILKFDGQKLGLSEGFFVTVHAESQFGQSILGDAGAFSLINTAMLYPKPNYRGTAITGVLFEQALSENFALAAGKINVVDLWTMAYPHVAGGTEGFMNTNMLAAALPWLRWVPLSVMGGGALFLTDDHQIEGGVIVFDTQNATTTSGFNDLFEHGTAYLGLWRFFFEVDGKPGSLLFAGGGSTRNYDSLDRSDWGFVPGVGLSNKKKNDCWTGAIYYDQIFWQAADNHKKNLRFFSGWSLSDGNPSFGKSGGFATIEGWGLIPCREKDRMGVGGFYNEISSDFKRLTAGPIIDLRDIWGVELYYNAELAPWMHVTGDVQLVKNINQNDETAVILGLRAVMDF
jgi:porin